MTINHTLFTDRGDRWSPSMLRIPDQFWMIMLGSAAFIALAVLVTL